MPDLYGISALAIAAALGVHLDTARRYKRTGRVPDTLAPLLALRLTGELGLLDAAWRGFRLVRGDLWTPGGWCIAPGEIQALPIRYQQLRELERRAQARVEVRELELTRDR